MMDKKIKAGRISKEVNDLSQASIDSGGQVEVDGEIRPDNVFGMTPKQLFIISLEIFLLVLFVGLLILFFTGKIIIP